MHDGIKDSYAHMSLTSSDASQGTFFETPSISIASIFPALFNIGADKDLHRFPSQICRSAPHPSVALPFFRSFSCIGKTDSNMPQACWNALAYVDPLPTRWSTGPSRFTVAPFHAHPSPICCIANCGRCHTESTGPLARGTFSVVRILLSVSIKK